MRRSPTLVDHSRVEYPRLAWAERRFGFPMLRWIQRGWSLQIPKYFPKWLWVRIQSKLRRKFPAYVTTDRGIPWTGGVRRNLPSQNNSAKKKWKRQMLAMFKRMGQRIPMKAR